MVKGSHSGTLLALLVRFLCVFPIIIILNRQFIEKSSIYRCYIDVFIPLINIIIYIIKTIIIIIKIIIIIITNNN